MLLVEPVLLGVLHVSARLLVAASSSISPACFVPFDDLLSWRNNSGFDWYMSAQNECLLLWFSNKQLDGVATKIA